MGSYMSRSFNASALAVDQTLDSVIFQPPNTPYPLFERLPGFQILTTVSGGRVPIAVFTPPTRTRMQRAEPQRVIVFSHGNASDIYAMAPYCEHLATSTRATVLCYDYIGYGQGAQRQPVDNVRGASRHDTGLVAVKPSEQGCYDSLDRVMSYVLNTMGFPPERVLCIAQSIGTGILVDWLSKYAWNTPVMLISPYKSVVRVVADTCLSSPIDYKLTSLTKLERVTCPVKIIHGEADTLINVTHGREMAAALRNKRLAATWLPGIGHNDILGAITPAMYAELFDAR